jgi:hypothetical protein
LATIYGNTTNHWRCYINTWSSEDGASVSAGLTVGIQDCGWGFQIWTGIVGHASANGSDSEVNTGFSTPTGSWNTKDITSASQRFVKGHNAYNVTLSGWVRNQSGYMNGTSSASQTITVPALEHHYVTFDANGGTGAPGRADKWYGEQVTIPTAKPTRTNYKFLGWSSTKDGSVEYQPGQKYWIDDRDMTYYAVWKLLYVPPKFSNGLAIRTNSMASTTPDHSGGYCYASFTYKVDTTIYPSNVAKSIVCRYYQDGSSTGVTVTPTGDLNKASGTINVHFKASINSVYYIECILTDTKDGIANIARSITTGVLPMEVANQGKSVGILSAAPKSAGLKLGGSGNPDFLIAADTTNNKLESMVQIHGSTSATGQGELTISTQGLDSEGNVARGNFNLIADDVRINSQPFLPKAWVLYEKPAGDISTWDGDSGGWYDNNGLFKHIEGPDHSDYWKVDESTNSIIPLRYGYWYIENVVSGGGNTSVMAGIFAKDNAELCTGVTPSKTNYTSTAFAHYLYLFTDMYKIGEVGWRLKVAHGKFTCLGRHLTYANIFYLGPA